MRDQLLRLCSLCPGVLLKGGHLSGEESVDLLHADGADHRFTAPRVATRNTHGTGCTLSSAIAALRPGAADWSEAVHGAKHYLTKALQAADELDVGSGHGPVHHFHDLWRRARPTGAHTGDRWVEPVVPPEPGRHN
jgi:hydroxymethylpyrimidine/phosphomethylpyrimidine kinase